MPCHGRLSAGLRYRTHPFRYEGCRPVSFRKPYRRRRPTTQHLQRGGPTDSHDYANSHQPNSYPAERQRGSRRTYCYSHPHAGRGKSHSCAAGGQRGSRPIYSHCYANRGQPNSYAAGGHGISRPTDPHTFPRQPNTYSSGCQRNRSPTHSDTYTKMDNT